MLSKINNSTALHRFISLLTILSFLIISYAIIEVANAPTRGYELSIYSSTPTIFWVAIIFGLLNGLFIIISELYGKTRKIWILGFFQIVFCNCLIICLHSLRGYALYLGRGDVSTHIGMANDIRKYGYFINNVYPITSIYISQVSYMTNISVLTISKYLPLLFFVIYVLSIYCLSKSLVQDRKFILSTLIASMPIFFACFTTSIYPMLLSVLTIPLFFYFLQRNHDYRFRFFSIIFSIIYPFFHPITAMVSFFYLVLLFIWEKLTLIAKRNVSIPLVLISFVSLVAWFIQQYFLLKSIRRIFLQLLDLLKFPTTSEIGFYYIDKFGFATAVRSLLLMISDEIVFYILSLFAIYVILKSDRITRDKFSKVSICFVMGSLFLLIIFFSVYVHSPNRLINLNFNMVLTPLLVGFLLYNFLVNNEKGKIIVILSLILFSAITAIFSLYPSPLTMLPNSQVTTQEIKGMNWLIIQKNPEIKTEYILSKVHRFADLIYGRDFRRGRMDLYEGLGFPDHFGFTEKNYLPINEDRYFAIAEFDIRVFTEIWKDLDRFEKEDFIKVNLCTNVVKIYENGEFRIYFVHKDD